MELMALDCHEWSLGASTGMNGQLTVCEFMMGLGYGASQVHDCVLGYFMYYRYDQAWFKAQGSGLMAHGPRLMACGTPGSGPLARSFLGHEPSALGHEPRASSHEP